MLSSLSKGNSVPPPRGDTGILQGMPLQAIGRRSMRDGIAELAEEALVLLAITRRAAGIGLEGGSQLLE